MSVDRCFTSSLRRIARPGFTLVELLVVIGIIALLISILLPTLGRARLAAQRTVCLSNMQQMAQAIYIYGAQFKGAVPPSDPKGNAGTSYTVWRHPNTAPAGYIQQYTAEGWVGPGYLFYTRILKDPKTFYCPSMPIEGFTYRPWEWENPGSYRFMGYLYRIFGEAEGPAVVYQALAEVKQFRFGKMKNRALVKDIQVLGWGKGLAWPHRNPWGVNVAYSDGHAEFVQLNKSDFDAAFRHATKPDSGVVNATHYAVVLFKALDNKDFTELRKTFK
ncbi:type II secretion system protein [Fontivita pretiosa]|uniref:type II secretion system protein n=1 Tax=Fontivita pretiosa TaxID=2989684 RepID=UPI003D163331